jgi:polyhydroxybutyrate depolymerase
MGYIIVMYTPLMNTPSITLEWIEVTFYTYLRVTMAISLCHWLYCCTAVVYPLGIWRLTGFTPKSDAEGFILVYPEGFGTTWNTGFGVGPAFAANVDDVGFIRELIDSLQGKFAIDGNRIYVAGFSNGAIMAYRLAAELSDRIAAVAPVSGTTGGRYNSTSPLVINVGANSAQPVSIIVFHGTADNGIPYNGGFVVDVLAGTIPYFLSVNESVSLWVRHDGCLEEPQIEEMSGDVIKYTYSGGAKGTEVVLYKVIGGQHEWPTTATDDIWAFFDSHPKKG